MDADLTWFELLRDAIDALKANAPAASVVIAVLAFLVSLATYRRAWRWRSEAEPAFVQVQGDMLLFPEFKRAGVDPVFIGWLANCGDGRAFSTSDGPCPSLPLRSSKRAATPRAKQQKWQMPTTTKQGANPLLHLQWLAAKHEISGNVEKVGYARHITQREI